MTYRFPLAAREQALAETQREVFANLKIIGQAPALLDVGCADMRRYSEQCRAVAGYYIGLDLDFKALRCGATRSAGKPACLVNGSAERLPFAPATFEIVVLNDTLAYCDQTPALREAARVLVPGGRLISLNNNSIGWSFYKLRYPEKPWLTEWAHSLLVLANTLQSQFTGRRIFRTRFNTETALRRALTTADLEVERLWTSRRAYRWIHFIARKPGAVSP